MAARICPRCKKPLSPERVVKRKKYCYLDEVAVKREQKEASHDRIVEQKYGLLPGEYRLLLAYQDGTCAIYKCKARGVYVALAVDHDHKCDKGHPKQVGCRYCVRGLLCKRHNRELGYNGDDPEIFESLADYLRSPPAREVLFK
jgi:hypothetical protein